MQCNITILVLILLSMNPLVHSFDAIVREDDSEFTFQSAVQPFLSKHCFDCHGNGESKADLSLDKYKDALSLIKERKIWDNVITMLEKHEMPPKEHPQPSGEEVERVVKAIDSILSNLDCGKPGSQPNAGRVTIRRLNRTEYNNTIRDLVGIDFRPANDFPADDVGYGFDNIGDVLSFSPQLAEKYLIAAESILEEAIVVMDPPKRTSSRVGQLRPTSAATKIEQAGFIAFEEGGYIIRAKVYADQAGTEVPKQNCGSPSKRPMMWLNPTSLRLLEQKMIQQSFHWGHVFAKEVTVSVCYF